MQEQLLFKDESYKIIGACMEVHRILGPGFLESVYQEALELELNSKQIPFIREKDLSITYKDQPLQKSFKVDFLCFDKIILELKALSALTSEHESQVINYLKAANLRLGILVNFGTSS